MKKFSIIAIALLSFVVVADINAYVLDFEDIAVPPGTNNIGGDRTSRGFLFDSLLDYTHLVNGAFLADNGTTYLGVDDYRGINPLVINRIGGGTFSLLSLDIAEQGDGAEDYARTVTVIGNLDGGGTVTTTLTLDGVFDGTGPLVDFQTETFDKDWVNLISVELKGYGAPNEHNTFAIDNICVPEPATMILLGLGGLAAIRRRKNNKSDGIF